MHDVVKECGISLGAVAGTGLGIGSFIFQPGGVLDSMWGVIDFLDGVPIGTRMQEISGIPCVVDNDVRAIALAESRYGAGANDKRVLTLTLGTGVGVCLTDHGHFTEKEAVQHLAGHIMVRGQGEWQQALDQPGCYCPVFGCMESTCSATAMEKLAKAWVAPDIDNIRLLRLAGEQNKDALRCLEFFLTCLERGLNQMVYLYSPDCIVLGGGITQGFAPYTGRLNTALTARVHSRQNPRVVLSRLKEEGGILGAALLYQQAASANAHEII